jgi:hypothetical protein
MQVPSTRPTGRPGQQSPIRLAHLVNVFVPPSGSEFEWVQPITLESLRRAREKTLGSISVELLTAQFPQDHAAIPDDFRATPDLQRSVRDVWQDASLPPLPLIADILQRLYENSEAEYLIYTNLDIAVQPHFYEAVSNFIRSGHDAFIINRRRLPGHYRDIAELPLMYADKGKSHPGFDCFVFRRELFPQFQLGNVCIGIPFIEILMGQNLFCHALNFKLFDQEHLTFHIGEDIFKPRNPILLQKNRAEFWKCIQVLWPLLDNRKFPYADKWYLSRWLKWGLHPCIPIRLCLQLELKKIFKKSAPR